MVKRRRIVLIVLFVAAIGAATWWSWPTPLWTAPEPVYKGMRLRYWLRGFQSGRVRSIAPTQHDAADALCAAGTNAIPFLIRWLQIPNPSWKDRLAKFAQKQHLVRISYTPSDLNERAFLAFVDLDLEPSNVVPQLVEVFDNNHSEFVQTAVPAILSRIGPPAEQAIPSLLAALDCDDLTVRNNAIIALGKIGRQPSRVVPKLVLSLSDTNQDIKLATLRALAAYGPSADAALPLLKELHHEESLLPTATNAPSYTTFPLWVQTSSSVKMFSGPMEIVRGKMTQPNTLRCIDEAIRKIDPETAYKLGIQ
jgi:hypothetical protein